MIRRCFCFVLVSVIYVAGSAPLRAEDPAPKKANSAAEKFAAADKKFAANIAEKGQLETKFQNADTQEEKDLIIKQYNKLREKRGLLISKLLTAARPAYLEAPNEDENVTQAVVGLLADHIRSDRYEDAVELGRLLIKHQCEDESLTSFVGIAAFCLNDIETAEQYLNQADESKTLSQEGRRYLASIEKAKLLWKQESEIRKKEAKADDLPRVKLATSKGDIVIELFENQAPQATANFVNLVEKKFYDGLTFHRVLGNFMAQGGCPTGDGKGGPGYKIYCECHKEPFRHHFRGTLSMAHAGRDTGGSQFFLTFRPTSHLDGLHTAFGRVIEGMDVLAKLQRINPGQGGPKPDTIKKATVLRKRDHKYEPTKVN